MFRISRAWPVVLFGLLFLGACGGGGTTVFPGGGGGFDLRITTDKTHGPAPLTVSFFVTPSGGTAPYTYAWDFNDDGVTDSNAPSGQYTYEVDKIARVTVTDAAQRTMNASQSITITPVPGGGTGGGVVLPLVVRINATPQIGRVPFDVQFSPAVQGGRAPYQFAWDFEGDGRYDEFTQSPLHRYSQIGQKLSDDHYGFFPVLKVTDSRGVTETNLQDIDGTAGPDGQLEITTLTSEQTFFAVAFANPQAGQAPLTVEFTANVGGGGPNITYSWDFGDSTTSNPSTSSLTTHTYQNPGTYLTRVTALDSDSGLTAQSAPITVTATEGQPFDLTVTADVTSGAVPFVVNFEAHPVNGQEPIEYEWNVFDNDPNNPNPTPGNPPSLDSAAVVTPSFTQRKDPAIHFGNTAGDAGAHEYRVRVAATDALGSQRVSEFIIVTAQPHTQPPPAGGNAYTAIRPLVVDQTFFPDNGQFTNNACFAGAAFSAGDMQGFGFPQAWGPRANAAVVSHPSGVTFIIGGERVASNGTFQGLVSHGDANYAYVPQDFEANDGRGATGKYGTQAASGIVQNGGVVRLNDGAVLAPPFPGTTVPAMGPNQGSSWSPSPGDPVNRIDTVVPLWVEPDQPPAVAEEKTSTSRSTLFNIVGSSAAVFMHEVPETNDDGLYPAPFTPPPMGSIDSIILGISHYFYPDAYATGWNIDNPNAGPPGLGVPVIYVFGGRTGATSAVDTVQKYYPYGFGTEDLVPMSETFRWQCTGNQADIWSNYFLRPDQDQFPGSGTNHDPQIETRSPGSGDNPNLPTLPKPLYGLMAVRMQTGTDYPNPTFPQSGYSYTFIMGGIEGENGGTGAVSKKMYWWDITKGLENGQDPGEDGIMSEMPDLPTPRAYGQAVLITDLPLRIAVTGGFDENNAPNKNVDIFTFADQFNPTTGSWSTFTGTLDEALRSTAVGWHDSTVNTDGTYVLSFGGFGETDFTHKMYSYRLNGGGTVAEALPVVPRSYSRAGQGGGVAISSDPTFIYNRYFIVGGTTEQGTSNIVEVASLP